MWDFGSGTDFQGTADQWQAGNFHSAGSQVKLTSTNGATWYVTGVQLEIGSTATDFEHKSFGEELALCQRYYEKSYDYDVVAGTTTYIGMHLMGGNVAATAGTKTEVEMEQKSVQLAYTTGGATIGIHQADVSNSDYAAGRDEKQTIVSLAVAF